MTASRGAARIRSAEGSNLQLRDFTKPCPGGSARIREPRQPGQFFFHMAVDMIITSSYH